ncbi:MAG: hypothetical protein P8Q41_11595 [Saprospiraceae bacterium]|nr:hypothetical protein [Saprospiraceae bacterium]
MFSIISEVFSSIEQTTISPEAMFSTELFPMILKVINYPLTPEIRNHSFSSNRFTPIVLLANASKLVNKIFAGNSSLNHS